MISNGKGKGKFCIRAKWPIRPELVPVSVTCNDQEYPVLLPTRCDASPSQGYPPAFSSPETIYTPGWRETL